MDMIGFQHATRSQHHSHSESTTPCSPPPLCSEGRWCDRRDVALLPPLDGEPGDWAAFLYEHLEVTSSFSFLNCIIGLIKTLSPTVMM